MQLTASAEQKSISQYITIYQSIINFSIDKIWLEVTIKYNKSDPDNMLDDCNAHLIEVCDEYLKEHKLSLDKFQLSTIVSQLWSKTISELEAPFRVTIREPKQLVQEYLEKNKSKREALERIKEENDELDKEIAVRKKENTRKSYEASVENQNDFGAKPEMPRKIAGAGGLGSQAPATLADIKKPKPRARWTDALAIDDFRLPL